MVYKVLVLAALVALSTASSLPSYTPPQPSAPPRYDFNWNVLDDASGNDYGHQEARDGYDTQGSYYVLLPDGRRQTVVYNVLGDAGYVAEVTYEGEARYTPQTYTPAPYGR